MSLPAETGQFAEERNDERPQTELQNHTGFL